MDSAGETYVFKYYDYYSTNCYYCVINYYRLLFIFQCIILCWTPQVAKQKVRILNFTKLSLKNMSSFFRWLLLCE